ncbi:MAG: ABC transporter substrate-binding protein [Anaerolineae bacterium]|jgi:peptide/nickel transport system substrate-binding protein|nr:ABC transporter substrate-binding protein [Anaerolineae bacterium]
MMKEYRWQLLALFLAIILFITSFIITRSNTPTPPPANTPAPTQIVQSEPTSIPTDAPQPVNNANPIARPVSDDIPTYREGLIGRVNRLNPLYASLNPAESDITSLIFEGMTKINQYGEIIPSLATEWVVAFDGLEYMVSLRTDVLWQDGTPFDADDVIYTVSILQSPDFSGAEALGAFWRTVEVEKVTDHLLRFRLAQPLATFPEAMRIGILPEHALRGTNAAQLASHPFNLSPIGTGAYQLEAIRADGGVIRIIDLRVAPNYRLRPEGATGYGLERIRFRLYDDYAGVLGGLQTGELDAYATRNAPERLDLLNFASIITPYTAYEAVLGTLLFNWGRDSVDYFRDERVRQALVLGLDRTSIIEKTLFNLAIRADSPLPPISWAYAYGDEINAQWKIDFNLAQSELSIVAQQLSITEGDILTFNILTLNRPEWINLANEISAQWRALRVNAVVEAVDLDTYNARLDSGEFDTVLVELSKEGDADPDVYAFWHEGQYPDGKNYGGMNDRTISEALERARRDVNGTNRTIFYHTFQREFIQKAVAIPLYHPLFTYAVNPKVTGIQLGFIGASPDRFLTIQDWQLTN